MAPRPGALNELIARLGGAPKRPVLSPRTEVSQQELWDLAFVGVVSQIAERTQEIEALRDLQRLLSMNRPGRPQPSPPRNGKQRVVQTPTPVAQRKGTVLSKPKPKPARPRYGVKRTLDRQAMPKTLDYVASKGSATIVEVANVFKLSEHAAGWRLMNATRLGYLKRVGKGRYERTDKEYKPKE